MNKLHVEPVKTYDWRAREVARNMRHEDVTELWELSRTRPREAVEQSIRMSSEAYVAMMGSEPVAVFGASSAALGDVAVPWMLGTRALDDVAAEHTALTRRFVAHLFETKDLLYNMAHIDNRRSLVYLRRVGFTIGKPFTVPRTGATAVMFEMRRENV